MMKNKKSMILFLAIFSFLLIFTANISAQYEQEYSTDPQLAHYTDSGYVIHPISLSKGETYTKNYINFQVYDISGKSISITNTKLECTVTMFSPEGDRYYIANNSQILNISDTSRYVIIPSSFFNETGYYKWKVSCQDTSTDTGGAFHGEILITPSGEGGTNNIVYILLILALSYITGFVGFFNKNMPVSALGGLIMMTLGIYLITQGIIVYQDWFTNVISYLTIGLGAIFSLTALVEYIEDIF